MLIVNNVQQLLQIVSPGTEDFDILGECKKEFQDLSDTTSDTWKKVENSRKISEIAGTLVGAEVHTFWIKQRIEFDYLFLESWAS